MRTLIVAVLTVLATLPVRAQSFDWLIGDDATSPFVVTLNEPSREHRNTGTITLRDPFTGSTLGVYQFATGGFGRGSAPWGTYILGAFRGTDDDPNGIGPRWMLRGESEAEDGEVYDSSLGAKRTFIELHRLRYSTGTAGCFGVLGDWNEFRRNLNLILDRVWTVRFVLKGDHSGRVKIPFVNIQQHHHIDTHKRRARPQKHGRYRHRHGR